MGEFQRKKVHVEFVSKRDVVLTTPYFQKRFHLKNETSVVDLIAFKSINTNDIYKILENAPSPFLMAFYYDKVEDSYVGEVLFKQNTDDFNAGGIADWKQRNKQTFEASVWVD